MTRALVTGSDGFIGQHLVKKLDSLGMEVVCVDRSPKHSRTIRIDVASEAFKNVFMKLDNELDYIFHFGSPCSNIQFNKYPSYSRQNTLVGFLHVLDLAEKENAQLIYPSSGNVYGHQATPFRENYKPKPINLYGKCKIECENLAKKSKLNTVGLRIFAGYGELEEEKGEVASVIYLFLRDMLQGKSPIVWGDGRQIRDFIHISDVITGIVEAMNLKGSYLINVGSGYSYSFNQVISLINKALQSNISARYIKKPPNYVEKTLADTSLMQKKLRVFPLSLEEGLSKFIRHLKKRDK